MIVMVYVCTTHKDFGDQVLQHQGLTQTTVKLAEHLSARSTTVAKRGDFDGLEVVVRLPDRHYLRIHA